jgi:hypothetical protein
MNRRIKFYYKGLRWTAIPLLLLMWALLLTGPGSFKGRLLERVTLGLVNVAGAGKWHSVWLPPLAAVIFFVHTTLGLQVAVGRARWIRRKAPWEVGIFVLGALGLAQFFWLFYG